MRGSRTQDYSYAIDHDKKLVHVSMAIRDVSYFCPQCGEIMVPHMGEIRRWHYEHKANKKCVYAHYLRKIAVLRIKEAFDSSSDFFIQYEIPVSCNKHKCIFRDYSCEKYELQTFNLKKYYNKCEVDITYNNLKCDLILSSTLNKNRAPVIIEILGKNRLVDDKIESGVRLIIIKISTEEDLERIVKTRLLTDNEKLFRREPIIGAHIAFYNFRDKLILKNPDYFSSGKTDYNMHFMWVKPDGMFDVGSCRCTDDMSKFIPDGADCIVADEKFPVYWGIFQFASKGLVVKNCLVCKHYSSNIYELPTCPMRDDVGPMFPEQLNAKECEYFDQQDYKSLIGFNHEFPKYFDVIVNNKLR